MYLFLMYLLLFIQTIFIIFILITIYHITVTFFSFAPWVGSPAGGYKQALSMAGLRPGQVFYDLGCGDGRVAVYAARKYGVKAVGIELCLPLFLFCKLRALFGRNKNIEFRRKNLFKQDLSGADAVYIYGLPGSINNKLAPKFNKELKPGAKVISYAFEMTKKNPALKAKTAKGAPIFIYQY